MAERLPEAHRRWNRAGGVLLVGVLGVFVTTDAVAQRRGRSRVPREERLDLPTWTVDPRFARDVFTFVRIEYDSSATWYGWEKWAIDYPDADWNLSWRLQQLTSLRVEPKGLTMRLTDPRLFDYPFIYIVEPGDLTFREEEVPLLRRYLLGGGFLMVDDFWGDREWRNFYDEIRRVFPDRDPQELDLSHPIFHCVFDLKEKPQIPNMERGTQSLIPGSRFYGVTWESEKGPSTRTVHYRGIHDDRGRLMVIICHNTDLGDGWEREGYNELFFREFSEKKAYPLGINIVFYAMTH